MPNRAQPHRRPPGSQLIIAALLALSLLAACTLASAEQPPTPTLFVLPTHDGPAAASGTPTAAPIRVERGGGDCLLNAEFVADVTIPDDTPIEPGQPFTKTWRMRNSGTCDWDQSYQIVHIRGAALGVTDQAALATPAAAGTEVEIAVDMIAPTAPGTYTSTWQLRSPEGTLFGTVPYVQIVVPAPEQAQAAASGADSSQPTPVPAATGCQLNAAFVTDVTIPDNTIIQPGQSFTKTWRMRNTSTCDWGEGYQLVWVTRALMGAPYSVPIAPTAAGGEVDVSVTFTAPAEPGTYLSTWVLRAPDGNYFGPRPYVQIVVPSGSSAAAAPAPQPTPVPAPTLAPAAPAAAASAPDSSYYYGLVTNVTARAREIYLDGQSKNNRRQVFSKVGDSITHAWYFLTPIGEGGTQLHTYSYLQPTVDFFMTQNARITNSFANPSLAVYTGWRSADVLYPANAEAGCGGLSPLECELAQVRPSVAVILLGTNDATGGIPPDTTYRQNMSAIIELCIEYGVVPLLSTVPHNGTLGLAPYNQVVYSLARQYGVPVMDLYTAIANAPHGLTEDGAHPSIPPGDNTANFTATNLQYGYTIRNLLTLHALDVLRQQVLY